LVRGGSEGEHEEKFLSESRVYVTWEGLNVDLKKLDWDGLLKKLQEIYDDAGKGRITNWASQLYPFAHEMKKGDWVVMPRKGKSVIAIAEIEGEYQHNPKGEDPYFHYRPVKWIKTDIPKSNFDQDVLYSFGAFMTICRLQRNDAEARVRAMAANGWKPTSTGPVVYDKSTATDVVTEQSLDIEQIARDSISKRIIARFKGHAMERLVEAVLPEAPSASSSAVNRHRLMYQNPAPGIARLPLPYTPRCRRPPGTRGSVEDIGPSSVVTSCC